MSYGRFATLGFACLAALAPPASGQQVVRSIWIPDSLHSVSGSDVMVIDSASGLVWLAGWDAERIQVYDARSGTKAGFVDLQGVTGLAHSPVSHRVYAASNHDWVVWAMDDRTLESVATFDTLEDPRHVAWCSREDKMYVGSWYGNHVWVFDPGPDTIIRTLETGDVMAMEYDTARNRLYVLNGVDVLVYDCATDSLVGALPAVEGEAFDMVIDYSRGRLYVAGRESGRFNLLVGDLDSLALVDSVPIPDEWNDNRFHLSLNGTTDHLYGFCWDPGDLDGDEDSVLVVDCATGAVSFVALPRYARVRMVTSAGAKTYVTPERMDSIAVLGVPDSVTGWIRLPFDGLATAGRNPWRDELYVTGRDEHLYVVDVAADSVVRSVNYDRMPARWLWWHPAGAKLYAATRTALYATTPDGTVLARFPADFAYLDPAHAPAYSAELDRLYVVTRDSLLVWDCLADTLARSLPLGFYGVASWKVPGRPTVYVCGFEDSLLVYDTWQDTFRGLLRVRAREFEYNPRNGLVYAGAREFAGGVHVIDPRTDSVLDSIGWNGRTDVAVDTRDNEVCVVRSGWVRDTLVVLDGGHHQVVAEVELPGAWASVCYIEKWNQLLAFSDSAVSVFDCPARRIDRTVRMPADARGPYLWNDRNDKLYAGSMSGLAVIRLPADTLHSVLVPPRSVRAMGWNPALNETYVSDFERIWVVADAPSGTLEPPAPGLPGVPAGMATVVRSVLYLDAGRVGGARDAELLDAAGRRVLELGPGPNDIRSLVPGVYFLRDEGGGLKDEPGSRTAVRKVIVQH